jgi:hypothetical protein
MDFIGTVQFFNQNGKRANPTALYLERLENGEYRISARVPHLRHLVGTGASPGKAAADFEAKVKAAFPAAGAYDGPEWNGIKAEKPAPPKPPPAEATVPPAPIPPSPTSPSAAAPGIPTGEGTTEPA